jgi:hypothetical protein
VREHGRSVSPERLFAWLGLALDQHGSLALAEDVRKEIRSWLEEQPPVVHALFRYWLTVADTARLRLESIYFWRRLQGPEPDVDRADFMFREAVQLRTGRSLPDAPSIDDLYAFVDRNPQFRVALQSEMSWEIAEWQLEDSTRRQVETREREAVRAQRVANLSARLEAIRSGAAIGDLGYLARIWFGLFADLDHELQPHERLQSETNDEIASAATSAFGAVLRHSGMLAPSAIGETNATLRSYAMGYAVLAGMDIVAARSTDELVRLLAEFPSCSEDSLRMLLGVVIRRVPVRRGWRADHISRKARTSRERSKGESVPNP